MTRAYDTLRTWISHGLSNRLRVVALLGWIYTGVTARAWDYNLHITCPGCTDTASYSLALTGNPAGVIATTATGGSGGADFGWFGGSGPAYSWGVPRIFTGTISKAGVVIGNVTINWPPDYVTEVTVAGASAPTLWTLSGSYTNSSDYERIVRVDLGDGSTPIIRSLKPGEVFNLDVSKGAAPTQTVMVEVSGPGAPDGGSYYAFKSVAPGEWANNGTTGGTGISSGVIVPGQGVAVDKTSKDSPKLEVGTPTGAASESSLVTGFSSVRTAVVEGFQAVIGKLESMLGKTPTSVPSGAQATQQSASDAANEALKGNSYTVVSPVPNPDVTPVSMDTTFMAGSETISLLNWGDSDVSNYFTLWRAFVGVSLAMVYIIFTYRHACDVMQPVMSTPSQGAASHVPVASSGTALIMATLSTVVFGAALASLAYLGIHLTASGVASGGLSMGGFGTTLATIFGYGAQVNAHGAFPTAMWLANSLIPMQVTFALCVAAPIYEMGAHSVAWGAQAALRHLVG